MNDETKQAIAEEVRKYALPNQPPPKKKADIFDMLAIAIAAVCIGILVASMVAWARGMDFPVQQANYSKWLLVAVLGCCGVKCCVENKQGVN